MQISQEYGQISRYFLCISLSKKSKFPSKWQNLLGMTFPNSPFFRVMARLCVLYNSKHAYACTCEEKT